MAMQDIDYELVYDPGKDEKKTLFNLSRHPLPNVGNDNTEKIILKEIKEEHAVILGHIQIETLNDPQLQNIKQKIITED